jgi:hypothetical protein
MSVIVNLLIWVHLLALAVLLGHSHKGCQVGHFFALHSVSSLMNSCVS